VDFNIILEDIESCKYFLYIRNNVKITRLYLIDLILAHFGYGNEVSRDTCGHLCM